VEECVQERFPDTIHSFTHWAKENNVLIARPQTPERSEQEADRLLKTWQTRTAAKAKWLEKLSVVPEALEKDACITVGDLHAYLSNLLTLHPDVAGVPVFHEECCGSVETVQADFDLEKERLCLT
jgi:hypothetical protein